MGVSCSTCGRWPPVCKCQLGSWFARQGRYCKGIFNARRLGALLQHELLAHPGFGLARCPCRIARPPCFLLQYSLTNMWVMIWHENRFETGTGLGQQSASSVRHRPSPPALPPRQTLRHKAVAGSGLTSRPRQPHGNDGRTPSLAMAKPISSRIGGPCYPLRANPSASAQHPLNLMEPSYPSREEPGGVSVSSQSLCRSSSMRNRWLLITA